MRDILFRGKRKDNGEWCEGFYTCVANLHYIATGIFDSLTNGIINTRAYKVDPETVGQYTGLADKNGMRIFEGDVVKIRAYGSGYHYTNVYFRDGKFAVDGTQYSFKDICSNSVEVIGNIYDNPELMEVNKI